MVMLLRKPARHGLAVRTAPKRQCDRVRAEKESKQRSDHLDLHAQSRIDGPVTRVLQAAALASPFFAFGSSMSSMRALSLSGHVSPLFIAVDRLLPAGAVLLLAAKVRGEDTIPRSFDAWFRILLFAMVDGTAFQLALTQGLQKTQAGLGSVIIDSQPLTVAILAALLYGEVVTTQAAIGLGVGVLGLLMLELPTEVASSILSLNFAPAISKIQSLVANSVQSNTYYPASFPFASVLQNGEFLMLLASQSMAIGTVQVPWVTRVVPPVTATAWHLIIGSVPLMAFSLASEPNVWHDLPSNLTILDLFNLVYATLLGGAAGYGIFFYFAQRGNVAQLSSLTFLTPIFAAATAYLTLDEEFTPEQLIGGAITLIGIGLVNTASSSSSSESVN